MVRPAGSTPVVDPGEGPGRPGPPLFFDQNEARRAEKDIFGDRAHPYPRVWMTAPPALSEGLDPPLNSLKMKKSRECTGAGLDNQSFSNGCWLGQSAQRFAHMNARLS